MALELCVLSGNLVDISGSPAPIADITIRPIKIPATVSGSFVVGQPIRTKPDAYGNFSIGLLRGMSVIIEIEWAGIKTQITIPDAATADLIDLLPPIA